MTTTLKPNKATRRKIALASHYDSCARLAIACGKPAGQVNGKKISVALWNLERNCYSAATAFCNGERVNVTLFLKMPESLDFHADSEKAWDRVCSAARDQIRYILGDIPAGFFVNSDARGHALKIDGETPEGKALIALCDLRTDWGGNGLLSPDITGD